MRIEGLDFGGMQRLVEYIARCPFSLARIVTQTNDGKVVYRAGNPGCIPFPKTGDKELTSGIPRNFEIFDPLDFLAEVTQHIPTVKKNIIIIVPLAPEFFTQQKRS